MRRFLRAVLAVSSVSLLLFVGNSALAQRQGGILRIYHRDSPASMSILEEATISTVMPAMGVFSNLVVFDQHVPQNSLNSIVPDLAESWSWNADGTELRRDKQDERTSHPDRRATPN
jgi:peptide/nickel transport system substrate-binding protein